MPSRPAVAALAFGSAFLLVSCTSSTTSVTAPTSDKCQVSATNSPSSFTADGGPGTVTVTAARDCTWSLAADASWISVHGPNSGQGQASVAYEVQANPAPAARSGSIIIASQRLAVSQAGAPCRFALTQSSDSIGADGGQLSVGVSTQTGCNWTASSPVSWIAIASGAAGSASGTVVLAVAANSGADRVATMNVAGQSYTVRQAGTAASPPPPPGSGPPAVDFSGSVSGLTGLCPSLLFHLQTLTVLTSDATTYRHGTCGDLHEGAQVSGSGLVQADGSVLATSIDLQKD